MLETVRFAILIAVASAKAAGHSEAVRTAASAAFLLVAEEGIRCRHILVAESFEAVHTVAESGLLVTGSLQTTASRVIEAVSLVLAAVTIACSVEVSDTFAAFAAFVVVEADFVLFALLASVLGDSLRIFIALLGHQRNDRRRRCFDCSENTDS